jgi:hypothetical protein
MFRDFVKAPRYVRLCQVSSSVLAGALVRERVAHRSTPVVVEKSLRVTVYGRLLQAFGQKSHCGSHVELRACMLVF